MIAIPIFRIGLMLFRARVIDEQTRKLSAIVLSFAVFDDWKQA